MVSPTERCSYHGVWPGMLIRTLPDTGSRLLPKDRAHKLARLSYKLQLTRRLRSDIDVVYCNTDHWWAVAGVAGGMAI